MKISGNLLIFSSVDGERTNVRKLKEKKLQIVLDEKNELPKFEVNGEEYIKSSAENMIEKTFGISNFYIEQLYTWGDPKYYTNNEEIVVTYLVVLNKKHIKNAQNLKFYDLAINNEQNSSLQEVILTNDSKTISYRIETLTKKARANMEYTNRLVGNSSVSELTAIIIHTGLKRLKNRVENTNIAFTFLDEQFNLSELQQVYEIILNKKLDSANFRKKIEPMVKKTEVVEKESAFRPSNKYIFNENYPKNWA